MGQSSQTQGIPKTQRNCRENKKENPRCATHNNRLHSSNNKQDLSRNNLLPHQHLRLRDKRVKPMLERTLQLGVSLNAKHLLEHPNNLAVTPVATPAVLPTSPNSSRRSPTACSTPL